jgi:histone chaperone ASF1
VTVILLTCAYDSREFVRVGYYVNNEYDSEELNADPPPKPILEKVRRNILAEKPRVTRFAIKWYFLHPRNCVITFTNLNIRDSDASAPAEFPPDQPEADLTADGDQYGAEEAEEEEEELAEGAEAVADPDAMVDDSEMTGAEVDPAAAAEEDEDAGSEDLEAESSGSEDEELEEEEVEGDGDADMDMDGVEKPNGAVAPQADAVMAQ